MAKVASSLGLAWKSRTSGTVLKSSLSSCTIVYCIHQLLPVDSKCNEAFRHRPAVCASHTCYDGGVWSLPTHDSDCLCLRCRIAALLLLPLLPWSPSSGGAMWTNGPARGRDTGRLSLHRFRAIVDGRRETKATIGFGSLHQGNFRLRVNHQWVIIKYCNA
jgi:hypothetical protein